MNKNEAHSPLGASNCERWWNCPGSNHLITQAPPARPSEYAAEGTVAHIVAAELLRDPKYVPPSHMVADGFEIAITDEMLDAVQVYVDYVNAVIDGYNLQPHQISIEERISLPIYVDGKQLFGTTDTKLFVPFLRLFVIDYKHGRGVKVDAAHNKQLLYYALGSYLALDDDEKAEIDEITLVIIQPRCPGGGIDTWTVSKAALQEFYDELQERAERVAPDAELKAGEWCKWCPAKPICPAIAKHAGEIAMVDFQHEAPIVPPLVGALTTEQKVRILEKRKELEDFLEAVASDLHTRAEAGEEIPGYKLVAKVGNRKWNDDAYDKLAEKLASIDRKALGGKAPPFMPSFCAPTKLISLGQAEKLLKGTCVTIDDLVHKPENGTALVKNTDKRLAIRGRADADFIDIESI